MPPSFSSLETQLAFSVYESKGVYAVLLGSGLSRAASIPTGWEITIDLVRRVGLAQGASDQADWAKWYCEQIGAEPNYSSLLEELASSQEERRSILHSYIEPSVQDREEGRKVPTLAHRAIADLIANGFIRVIITTNFDRLLENALRERGIEPTIVSSVDALSGAEPITHSACYILKLHGDYKDARILNTDSELEKYPPRYDALLDRIFDEYGLIVCGWSGEWDHALRAALLRAPNRRYPMYWAVRGKLGQAAQELADHRRARVITIANADEFFVGLRERVESLSQSQRQNPNSIELLISTAKRYLGRPEYRIQLHDLFEQETRSLLQRTDSDEFSPNAPWAIETLRNRRDKYEAITEPMARLAGVAGRWGDDNELGIILDVVRSLQRDAGRLSAGLNHYINIRLYPAVLVFTAYGLGLTRSERWRALHQLFSVDIDLQYREPKRAIEVLFPHCWDGGGKDIWNQIEKQNLKTPLSDHLHSLFTEWGASFAALTPDFQLLFERFEILGALAYLEANTREEIEKTLRDSQDFLWMPVGRSLWHERNTETILTETQKEPMKSELAKAGFASGNGDMLNLYGANFKRMSGRLRWM
jgi:hypothetical protein